MMMSRSMSVATFHPVCEDLEAKPSARFFGYIAEIIRDCDRENSLFVAVGISLTLTSNVPAETEGLQSSDSAVLTRVPHDNNCGRQIYIGGFYDGSEDRRAHDADVLLD